MDAETRRDLRVKRDRAVRRNLGIDDRGRRKGGPIPMDIERLERPQHRPSHWPRLIVIERNGTVSSE